jgi:hypothetical protein
VDVVADGELAPVELVALTTPPRRVPEEEAVRESSRRAGAVRVAAVWLEPSDTIAGVEEDPTAAAATAAAAAAATAVEYRWAAAGSARK